MQKSIHLIRVLVAVCVSPVWAQDPAYPVWRCGHEFTNQPRPGENCQMVELPAEIIMTAPRKRSNLDKTEPTQPPIWVMPRIDLNDQQQRDGRAKSILNDELIKTQTRCQQLPANSTELVRCRADEAALRRELARAP
ncbi:MAG: hypothetical protein ACKO69_06415 [Limnohabitans sp.]